jgi:gliding motility-associated-like protein
LYDDLSVGIYTAVAESRITGCISGPAPGEIKNGMAYPEFSLKIKPANCGQSNGGVELIITNSVEIESIQWDVNDVVVTGPILAQIPAGIYTVNIITKLGCAVSGTATVETEIRPFNGISRNRDGQNETFYIDCIQNFPNNLVKIYNRAGTLVYQEEGYNNIDMYFDGKSNQGISPMGSNLPDGTYYYVIDKGDGSNRLAGYMEIVK